MEGEEGSSRAIRGASLGGLPTPASRASFRLGSVFNGQEIGWDDAIATRRREEVQEWESQGPGPVTEEQGTRGKEKDPDWRPAPGEAAGTSGGSGDEGWGGRGGSQAGASGAAAKRPRTSGPVGSGAGGAGPASNSQPQGAAAGGSEGSGAAGAGTSAAAAGVAPLGGSAGAGASQRSDRAGRTPTDEELDPWTEEVLRNAEPGLVRGMFSEKDVKEARNCKICKKKISWKGSCTSTGKRHLKRSHYPSLQIWCRRFKDPNKPDNLTFPDGGWGPDVPDQTAWPWEHAATWPRIVQTPDSAVTGGSEVGGSRQMSMAAFVTPRVHGQQLREGLVQLFAAADLPFRLVECREFRAFVQMLNPGAALLLGSRHRLARDMMAYGEAAREDMRQLLVGDGLAGRMSLTFDIWTGENNVAFMGVTAHYVTSDFLLKQAVIDFRELKGSHTGDLIADELEEVLWEWGLEKMLFAYNALIDLQEKAQLTPGISPLRSSLITAALSKLERHMGGVSEEAAIATFLDPRQKLAPFKHRARAAEGNSRGATLELGPDRVKALVRARLSEYQAASTTALGDGGEVTSARGAGVHASAGGGAVDASANVSIQRRRSRRAAVRRRMRRRMVRARKEEDTEGSGDDSEAAWDPETHGGGEGGDDEMDGLEPEGREEEVGEGGGRAATEAGSQHVREGGGSVGVKVGGRKAVTIREPRQRKKANKLRERAYPCTFTGEPLGEGVIAPEFLDEDGGSESSKGTGKGNRKPGWQVMMFGPLGADDKRQCKICTDRISWNQSTTTPGERHFASFHTAHMHVWHHRYHTPSVHLPGETLMDATENLRECNRGMKGNTMEIDG
ncbi:unnamed protein product [Closterium sp. NIES-65]|nr:unnamed protein product [Closterium sp. NIES-65]